MQNLTIEGTVQTVVFQNPENGYTVVRMYDGKDSFFAVGQLPGAVAGELLKLEGVWATHPSYGEQFRIERAERSLPKEAKGIYDYLASGAIKGVGAKTARLIVDAFGSETLDVIAQGPSRLEEVKGISPKKALEIYTQLLRQMGLRDLMEFLVSYNIKPYTAAKLYEIYGDEAKNAVRENPYIMADGFFGVEFFEADSMAMSLGFEADCRERVEAAVVFELKHNLGNGHVFLPAEKLYAAVAQLIGVDESLAREAGEELAAGGYLEADKVLGIDVMYLHEMYMAEIYVANRLLDMAGPGRTSVKRTDSIIARIEKEQKIKYAELQKRAMRTAAENRVTVLTGGPGTGKTTSVRGILALFDALGYETMLAAPTGRAAKRLSELTGREAMTVHRLLGAKRSGEGVEFEKNINDPLKCQAVILDEASMMDLDLTAALLRAMPPEARLVMVGDADQLPSVGAGNVFSDIIRSRAVPVIRLTEIFRQADESDIIKTAHSINMGENPSFENKNGDMFFLQRTETETIAETAVALASKRLPENMRIPVSDIQVLCPSRRYGAGTVSLNAKLQAAINPPADGKKEKPFGSGVFRVGDRVMQISNNYDIIWQKKEADGLSGVADAGIFNGDIGYITDIDAEREILVIDFDGRITPYPFELMQDLELAYAVTVHKSQGSEYRAVIICLQDAAPMLQTRSVLYTAVARAKELAVIVGDRRTAYRMIENDRRQRRYSGLRARLAGEN